MLWVQTDSNTATIKVYQPFTDDQLTTAAGAIRMVHIIELRDRINAQRVRFGLSLFAWTDPNLTGQYVKAIHITEMRTALQAAYVARLGRHHHRHSRILRSRRKKPPSR